jgi:uncharacterized membrane protein YphA (DoxX/SURF4 family)
MVSSSCGERGNATTSRQYGPSLFARYVSWVRKEKTRSCKYAEKGNSMIRRIARPLLGSIFIYSGFQTLLEPEPVAHAAEPLVDSVTDIALSDSPTQLPGSRTLARAYGGVQFGAGLLLATGRTPRLASLVLAGTLVPAAASRPFWRETDPAVRQRQTVEFLKDVSLLGGLIIAGFDTEGAPGPLWRARRASDRAAVAIRSALPGSAGDDDSAHRIDAVRDFAAKAGDRLDDLKDTTEHRISAAIDKSAPLVSKSAATAADTTSALASSARKQLGTIQDQIPQVASAIADSARRTLPPAVTDQIDSLRHHHPAP